MLDNILCLVEKCVTQYFKHYNIKDIKELKLAQNNVKYYIHSKFGLPGSIFNAVFFKGIPQFPFFTSVPYFNFNLVIKTVPQLDRQIFLFSGLPCIPLTGFSCM